MSGLGNAILKMAAYVAAAVVILLFPAVVFALFDIKQGTALFDLYKPVMTLTLSVFTSMLAIILELVDFVVNSSLDFMQEKVGLNISARINLSAYANDVTEQMLFAISAFTLPAAATGTMYYGGGSGSGTVPSEKSAKHVFEKS